MFINKLTFYAILIAIILDLIIGDPQNPFHPIRFIGRLISFFVKFHKKIKNKSNMLTFIYGAMFSISIIVIVFLFTYMTLNVTYGINSVLGFAVETIICYFVLAPKSLYVESMKIYKELDKNNLETARLKLSFIVGRDTENLNEEEIVKATVETVAENFADGVIAPLMFLFIGGPPLAMAYKAVNTLDSMVGYRNKKYEYMGKFPAILDDIVNFIPARLSAFFLCIGAITPNYNFKNAVKIYFTDRLSHKSPNSAQTESVSAGALEIQLGGASDYKGKTVIKPTIGKQYNKTSIRHIKNMNKLMFISYFFAILTFSIVFYMIVIT